MKNRLELVSPTSWLDVSALDLGSKPRRLEHLATPTEIEEHQRNLSSHHVGNHGREGFQLDCTFGHKLHQILDNLDLPHLERVPELQLF